MIPLAFLVAAFVAFLLAAVGVTVPKVQLVPLGLALWAASLLAQSFWP